MLFETTLAEQIFPIFFGRHHVMRVLSSTIGCVSIETLIGFQIFSSIQDFFTEIFELQLSQEKERTAMAR